MLKNQPQVVLIDVGQREIAHNDLVAKVPKTLLDLINEQPWERVGRVGEREGWERETDGARERREIWERMSGTREKR